MGIVERRALRPVAAEQSPLCQERRPTWREACRARAGEWWAWAEESLVHAEACRARREDLWTRREEFLAYQKFLSARRKLL